jgi:hypothetical protein
MVGPHRWLGERDRDKPSQFICFSYTFGDEMGMISLTTVVLTRSNTCGVNSHIGIRDGRPVHKCWMSGRQSKVTGGVMSN